jgi:hypothetical protein
MKKILFISSLLLCFATASIAGGSPSETVHEYCQKDFDGDRLSSETWQKVATLIAWEHEQGWDVVTGISEFKIISEEITDKAAKVKVQFLNESGTLDEIINIKLRNDSCGWKISSPACRPHVSNTLLCNKFNRCETN